MKPDRIQFDVCVQRYEEFERARRAFRDSAMKYIKDRIAGKGNSVKMDLTLEFEDACGLSTLQMPLLESIYIDDDDDELIFDVDGSELYDFQMSEYELIQIVRELKER